MIERYSGVDLGLMALARRKTNEPAAYVTLAKYVLRVDVLT